METLEDFVGHKISDQALREAIALLNANRTLLRRLCSLVRKQPGLLPLKFYYGICEQTMFMPGEEYVGLLAKVIDHLEKKHISQVEIENR